LARVGANERTRGEKNRFKRDYLATNDTAATARNYALGVHEGFVISLYHVGEKSQST